MNERTKPTTTTCIHCTRLFLQHGGPRLDEVGRPWGTQGDAARERLRVATQEKSEQELTTIKMQSDV
jgi:hypothetical protein